jgi:hypothetical protein
VKVPTKETPQDVGQVESRGTCQVCGAQGPIIVVPGAPPPSTFCPRCAIEYGQTAVDEDSLGEDGLGES